MLVVWLVVARRPHAGLSAGVTVAAAALGGYCAWVLASASWSDAASRSLLEFDRAYLYLLALLLGAALPRSPARISWLVRGLAAGAFVVCAAAFVSRTFPDAFTTAPGYAPTRLSFPLTYWNGLGLMAVLGLVFSATLAIDRDQPPAVRALAAATTPMFCATAVLTLGRGPLAVGAFGVVALLLFGRGAGLLSGVLACLPTAAAAVYATLSSDLLGASNPTGVEATAEGHELALIVLAAGVAAAAIQLVVGALERKLPSGPGSRRFRWLGRLIPVAVALVALAVAWSNGLPEALERGYEKFQSDAPVANERERLGELGSNGRVELWNVAADAFEKAPARGTGAGTYELLWERDRPLSFQAADAHSLYFETLAELGVVGVALLAAALAAILFGFAWGLRGPSRIACAGLLAAALTWALEAGVDWAWEMPAVTAWLFFAGGAALAGEARTSEAVERARTWPRVIVSFGLVLVALVPLNVAISETRLKESRSSFASGDCEAAIDEALGSLSAVGVRAEPYAILGYCDLRLGNQDLAAKMMRQAISADPGNWEYTYGLALIQAASGLDPRPQARRALAQNPRGTVPSAAVEAFATSDPAAWRAASRRLPLPSD